MLPGIGEKSAQRLAFFLISMPQNTIDTFASKMVTTRRNIQYCKTCFNISWTDQCHICQSTTRSTATICVVADPRDIFALERSQTYRGVYHVLGGLLSPIEGIHPDMLRIQELLSRIQTLKPAEVILAINPTIEGEATILYLHNLLEKYPLKCTKLAYGLPIGSDIDYADDMTLQRAWSGRREINETLS